MKINERKRIINTITREKFLLMIDREEIKRLMNYIKSRALSSSFIVTLIESFKNITNIIFNDDSTYENLDSKRSIRVITLDYVNEHVINEVIDAKVKAKRKNDVIKKARRIKQKIDFTSFRSISFITIEKEIKVADANMFNTLINHLFNNILRDSTSSSSSSIFDITFETHKFKYQLASKLNQTIDSSQIEEKVINTSMKLSLREFLTVSIEIDEYLHEQTRKRRVAVENTLDANASTVTIDFDDKNNVVIN